MSKTPYEIRLDLLSMANDILSDKNFKECERLREDWQTNCELAFIKAQQQADTSPVIEPFPDMPSVDLDEIITLAKKLNDFVSGG